MLSIGATPPVGEAEAGDAVPPDRPPCTRAAGTSGWSTDRTARTDFLTAAGVEAFYATAWQVHHHSDRTGIRLIGPAPEWARRWG